LTSVVFLFQIKAVFQANSLLSASESGRRFLSSSKSGKSKNVFLHKKSGSGCIPGIFPKFASGKPTSVRNFKKLNSFGAQFSF
jgi:hypothetical protein